MVKCQLFYGQVILKKVAVRLGNHPPCIRGGITIINLGYQTHYIRFDFLIPAFYCYGWS